MKREYYRNVTVHINLNILRYSNMWIKYSKSVWHLFMYCRTLDTACSALDWFNMKASLCDNSDSPSV